MASLIPCPGCEKLISPDAWRCTGCGHPVRRDRTRARSWKACWIILALSVFMLFTLWPKQ